MISQNLSTRHIDYIEKDFLDDTGRRIDTDSLNISALEDVQLLKVNSLTDFWISSYGKNITPRLFMEDILAGLYEEGIPLVFAIFASKDRVEVLIGTYGAGKVSANDNLAIVQTSLLSSFQGIEMEVQPAEALSNKIDQFNFSGLVTGIPSSKKGSEENGYEKGGIEQIERLIRGLYGKEWGYVLIAAPTTNDEINTQFNAVLNEMRVILNAEKGVGMESPICKRYKKLLEVYLDKLQLAKALGLWHTSVFLYSRDAVSLSHVKAVAKATLAGKASLPDRIRTHTFQEKINYPGLILNPPSEAPGYVSYPYALSSTINSSDLASYVQLPSQEMPGFQIKPYARFNVSPDPKKGESINIGKIIDQGNETESTYNIVLKQLKKHGLIVGGTGSGKTNTLFYLLKEAWKHKVSFMVIEPVKTEYRKLLLSKEMGEEVQVFTLGNNNVSPFRINPFEIMPGVSVQTHIDLLKAVFNASFFMWGPLPHVLERCIHDIYTDKGWDLTSNQNPRGVHKNAHPTLTDLYHKVDQIVASLGYSSETTMEISSALKTRIDSLRIGGKGLMLDTSTSIPFEKLINQPTILELEPIGDDEEKSFMMGLILTMMYEHHMAKGITEDKGLVHLTVIEEAHRLLGNYMSANAFTANAKGKAVETFTNILAEIRAYGEGFLIAEQIPTKLASDVIKNTNLKVMHRVVAEDDRKVMGATMNIGERETKKIVSLNVGEAAVYSEGDDGAFHVKVPYSKIEGEESWKGKGDELVIKAMANLKKKVKYFTPFVGCQQYCEAICEYKNRGNAVAQKHRFYSQIPPLVLSLISEVNTVDSFVLQILETVEGNTQDSKGLRVCSMIQGAESYFKVLGNRYQWPFEEAVRLKELFLDIYYDMICQHETFGAQLPSSALYPDKVDKFKRLYERLCQGQQPTPFCSKICPDNRCLYRFNMQEALNDEYFHRNFVETVNQGGEQLWKNLDNLCKEAAREAIFPNGGEQTNKKIALCFALQKSYSIKSFSRVHIRTILEKLIETEKDTVIHESKKLK
ncbi:hypothetical protein OKW21_002364 [Catalinimonas alkaloidigena]|uniref:ATP-binding protein n=1 Tax=Catalinimonas alkaloidigena TaxID=1075417 RepID=UPI0024062E9A|nr:ATP-binding protein [Catalinimonas alkaloidigena]MDF9797101.1 hypothetical protein [Catalinimonas alkaloidigena]